MRHSGHLQIVEVGTEVVVAAIREVAVADMTDIREEVEAAMMEITVVAAEDTKAAMAVVAATKEILRTVEVDMMEAQEDVEVIMAALGAVEVIMAASGAVEVMMAALGAVEAMRAATEVVGASKEATEVVVASEVVEDIKEEDMAAEVVSSSPMKEAITEVVVEEAILEEMDSMESHQEQHRKADQETSIMTSVEEEAVSPSAVVTPTSNGNTKNQKARQRICELIVY
jgi:hypothetical protein